MRVRKSRNIFWQVALLLLLVSCEKPEGVGGRASIRGMIWEKNYNSTFTILNGEYPSPDRDVFIIYGNNISYGDKTSTNYRGEFEFKYLREGNYRIYVYSKDNTLRSASGDTVFIRDVTIGKRKETITLDTITIYE